MLVSLDRYLARRAAIGPLVLRLGLGGVFVAHGLAKAFVATLPQTARYFAIHGFPGWTAHAVFGLEVVGGLALVFGVATRLTSLALAVVMVGAVKPHLANGFFFSNPGGGWEYVAFLVVALGALAFLGGGALALEGTSSSRTRRSEGGDHALSA